MTATDMARGQLLDEVQPVAEVVARQLGLDVAHLMSQAEARAAVMLADAAGSPAGALDLAALLHGPDADPPPGWWATPLGLVVAGALSDDPRLLTHQQAADILGCARATVGTLTRRETLPTPVTRGAVLTRLCRLRGHRSP